MPVSVRPASYDSDRQELVDVLQSNLPYRTHSRFFGWLYLSNPDGHALAWVAVEKPGERIVGIAAAFPRRVYCAGIEESGFVLGDFCIASEYRSLGLAVLLQRACLEGLSSAGARFAFDLPSSAMLAVYRRLQIDATTKIVRYAKPLRMDRKLARRIPVPAIARGLGAMANACLRWRDAAPTCKYAIKLEEAPWGEEFAEVAKSWSGVTTVCVARTSAYLNWRYGQHPQTHYEMLTARDGPDLRGYLIQHIDADECTIDDLVVKEESAGIAILAKATAMARERGLQTVSIPWTSAHPGHSLLENCGFRPRDSQQVISMELPLRRPEPGLAGVWHLSRGDWDS